MFASIVAIVPCTNSRRFLVTASFFSCFMILWNTNDSNFSIPHSSLSQRWLWENSPCQGPNACFAGNKTTCGGRNVTCFGSNATCHGENINCKGPAGIEDVCHISKTVCHADTLTCSGRQMACFGDNVTCHKDSNELCHGELEATVALPMLYRDVSPNPLDYNIYLLETSAVPSLQSRLICSLESYCLSNPGGVVWLLTTSCQLDHDTMKRLTSLQRSYSNLRVAVLNVYLALQTTPLNKLYDSENFWKTKYLPNNLSNMARLAIVYRSGGLYTDTDVIAWRHVTNMTNIIVKENWELVNNAVFHFDRGHPFLKNIMIFLVENFQANAWGKNGPIAITSVFKQYSCFNVSKTRNSKTRRPNSISPSVLRKVNNTASTKDVVLNPTKKDTTDTKPISSKTVRFHHNVCDLTILSPVTFYPIHWSIWKSLFSSMNVFISKNINSSRMINVPFFKSNMTNNAWKSGKTSSMNDSSLKMNEMFFPQSYGIHLSNHLTKGRDIPADSLVETVLAAACPVINVSGIE